MARIRTHKPEFWTSEQVTECSIEARLLFLGLLNFVDDGGRMPYSAKRIKGQIYPHDDFTSADIHRMVGELSVTTFGDPMVVIYEVEGKQYLEITGFSRHQKVEYPTYQFPDRSGSIPKYDRPGRNSGHRPSGDQSVSGRHRKGREGKGMEGNQMEGKGEESARARGSPPPKDDWPDDYREQFSAAYPHKVDIAKALDVLEGVRRKGEVTWQFLMEQVRAYAAKSDDAYWASPTNWLKGERWNDKPAKPPVDSDKHRTLAGRAAERVREMEARERSQAPGRASGDVGGAEIGGDHARIIPAPGRE